MSRCIFAVAAACVLTAFPAIAQDHSAHQQTKLVKGSSVAIEGCVTAGQKSGTFVLGTVKEIPNQPIDTGKRRVYWVERKHLRGHVGHVLQLTGRIDDVSTQELEVKSTDEGIVVEIEVPGRQGKTTPDVLPVPTSGQKEVDIPTTVIKLKVDKVTMVKDSCS
jgi:hypothetical protein